jgi:anti-anti-sigma factor
MTTRAETEEAMARHRIAFVKLPQAVDVSNDRLVLDSLATALAGHPSVVIADASATAFCDCAGISVLLWAHRRAAAAEAQLRIVAANAPVQRILKLTAADEVLNVYLTMDDALADMTGGRHLSPLAAPVPAAHKQEPHAHCLHPEV